MLTTLTLITVVGGIIIVPVIWYVGMIIWHKGMP